MENQSILGTLFTILVSSIGLGIFLAYFVLSWMAPEKLRSFEAWRISRLSGFYRVFRIQSEERHLQRINSEWWLRYIRTITAIGILVLISLAIVIIVIVLSS